MFQIKNFFENLRWHMHNILGREFFFFFNIILLQISIEPGGKGGKGRGMFKIL